MEGFSNAEITERSLDVTDVVRARLDRREISLSMNRPIPRKESAKQKRRFIPFEMTGGGSGEVVGGRLRKAGPTVGE